ncbi:MAG: sialic acid TRAP transporter substrate-binding protein SiaP [Cardiobacteriaceae bacterium]|nr:sialic acid TRAP transporter substrate-binding protein SiaP [Cardiobacteriaceae bacterium]
MLKPLSALVLAAAVSASAHTAETLRFAHVYETGEPFHQWALWAADEIKTRSDGRYAVEVFPASSLGKEADLNEGLQLGTVDIIYTGAGFLGRQYPPLNVVGESYMFRDFDHWQAFTQSDYFRELADGFQRETGHVVLALNYYGTRHVTANKPVEKPADMQNLRIRIPNAQLYMIFPRAVGANPTPLAFDEVYLALQQGVVDAQENPLPTIRAKAFYEVQKHIALTGHITESLATIVSATRWNSLSPQDQAMFREVFAEAAKKNTADTLKAEGELAAWFAEQGNIVHEVDTQPFREAVLAYKKTLKDWDEAAYNRVQAIP